MSMPKKTNRQILCTAYYLYTYASKSNIFGTLCPGSVPWVGLQTSRYVGRTLGQLAWPQNTSIAFHKGVRDTPFVIVYSSFIYYLICMNFLRFVVVHSIHFAILSVSLILNPIQSKEGIADSCRLK